MPRDLGGGVKSRSLTISTLNAYLVNPSRLRRLYHSATWAQMHKVKNFENKFQMRHGHFPASITR